MCDVGRYSKLVQIFEKFGPVSRVGLIGHILSKNFF